MSEIFMARIDIISIYERNKLLSVGFYGAFKSFRGASEWLIDENFEVSYDDYLSELLTEPIVTFTYEDKENDQEHTAFIEAYSIFE